MNKIIFTIFFFAFFTVLNASNVFACSCVPQGDESIEPQVKEAYTNSTAVFVGEVVEVIQKPDTFITEVKFKVLKSWKNEFKDAVVIKTGRGGGDCGYEFEVGKKYLVYAYGDKGKLGTNICTRTSVLESNKDVAFLDKIKKIKKSKIKYSPK
ncbi:MAG TPA: hypothetical protein VGP58_09910 [Pyrinomonadaceae bacterium]|jgi:hypothetical protein|nr:hypothetical protein [Pyrinomonadaceae bacterium]